MPFNDDGTFRPNFMTKIVGFTLTYTQWAVEGFPRRDPTEVSEYFHTYCNPPDAPCELYQPTKRSFPVIGKLGVCDGCGCHVSDDAEEVQNAVTYPNKGCPKKHWLPVVDPEESTS